MKRLFPVFFFSLLFAAALAEQKRMVVQVTGGGSDSSHRNGYYVEYTINGTKYRSDEVGQKVNANAWAYMSDADRKKAVKEYTFFADRREQFGEETAIQMGNWYNKDWIAASEILTTRLVERDFPGLSERFSDSQAYFAKNFMPTTCSESELDEFAETRKLFAAEKEFFSWACAAYAAMFEAERRRHQVSVKAVAGELISLICDKALVPAITPSGALSGAEAIGQMVFAEIIEYMDKASGYCDNVVATLAGRRVTADVAVEVMNAMANTIDCQYEIIKRSLAACHEMQNKIDAVYPGLKEAADAAAEEKNRRRAEAAARISSEPTTGEPDAAIAEGQAEKQQAVAAAQTELNKFNDSEYYAANGGYDGQLAALAAVNAARAAEIAYNQAHYDNLQARYLKFKDLYANAVEEDESSKPAAWNGLADVNARQLFFFGRYPLDAGESEVAAMQADLQRLQNERRSYGEAATAWNAAAGELLIAMRKAYFELSTDWDALSLSDVVRQSDDFGSGGKMFLDAVAAGIGEHHGSYGAVSYDGTDNDENAKMADFLARRDAYLNSVVPAMSARYAAGVKSYDDAVAEYDEAWKELSDVLEGLPSYVKSQQMCASGLVVSDKSELAQKFLVEGASGTLEEAKAIRAELKERGESYRKAKRRVAVAETMIAAAAAAFGTGGLYAGQFNVYGRGTAAGKFKPFGEISQKHKPQSVPEEARNYPRALMALEQDFDNHTYAHTEMIGQLGDLTANRELYSTNVLEETQDPYVRQAHAARCLSVAPQSRNFTTPMSVVMPGYYVGYGKTPYEIAMLEAADRNRGTCSYSYFIPGYSAAVGNISSDPFDNYIKPLLDEIDAARASRQPANPEPEQDPEPEHDPEPTQDPEPEHDPEPTLFDAVEPEALVAEGESYKGATYNGFLGGGEDFGGTFTLVVKKPKKGQTAASATLTKVDAATGKKTKISGAVDVGTGEGAEGLAGLVLSARGVGGALDGVPVQGAVDASKAKDKDALGVLAGFNKRVCAFVLEYASGSRAMLTAAFSAKGKVKVAGTVGGVKISGSAQMSVGGRCAVPFAYVKASKGVAVSFVLWFDRDTMELLDVSGLGAGAELVACGPAEAPAPGPCRFVVSEADVLAAVPEAIPGTPFEVPVAWTGKKFDAGKAAKVSCKKGVLTVDTSKGGNVSGLSLKHSKGALSGSFTVYALTANGKLAKNKFAVNGILVGGVGYASATCKKLPPVAVALERDR